MPRLKKEDWERVTITMSGEAVHALRILAAITRQEMGEVADDYLKRGGLMDGVSMLPTRARSHPPQSPAKAPAPAPAPPQIRKMTEQESGAPAAPRQRTPKNGTDDRYRRLLAFVEKLLQEGRFSQGELMAAMTPPSTAASYRSGWRATGHVPEKHSEAVVRFLLSKGITTDAVSAAVKPPPAPSEPMTEANA